MYASDGIRILGVAALILASASCIDSTRSGASGAIRIVSSPSADTAAALLSTPLTVEVAGRGGVAVVFSASITATSGEAAMLMRTPTTCCRSVDTLIADSGGRASMYLRLGYLATTAIVTVSVPELRDSVLVAIAVRPAAPARIIVSPADTTVYVGRGYMQRGKLTDKYGNEIANSGLTFSTDSAAVSVDATGELSARAIGRARIVVRAGELTDTAWVSVVPQGRIAATRTALSGADAPSVVLVNLDGSGYRSFGVNSYDVPRPTWHPSGQYLVASRSDIGEPSTAAMRHLAALDTTTGAWRTLSFASLPSGEGAPQFSADGQWLYFAHASVNQNFSSSASSIHRVRADGSGVLQLIGYDARDARLFDFPSPSPDGQSVAMTAEIWSGTFIIIRSASASLGPIPDDWTIMANAPRGERARWSPLGDQILMIGSEGLWLARPGTSDLTDRRFLARDWAAVMHTTGGFRGASWSPDGKWIVARAEKSLILIEVATGRVLPLAFGAGLSEPAWRPH